MSIAALNNFANEEGIDNRYIANINFGGVHKGSTFVPSIVADRILR